MHHFCRAAREEKDGGLKGPIRGRGVRGAQKRVSNRWLEAHSGSTRRNKKGK